MSIATGDRSRTTENAFFCQSARLRGPKAFTAYCILEPPVGVRYHRYAVTSPGNDTSSVLPAAMDEAHQSVATVDSLYSSCSLLLSDFRTNGDSLSE